MANLIDSFKSFTSSATQFSWTLGVFGLSQGAKVVNGLPTDDPTASATASFKAAGDCLDAQLGSIGKRVSTSGSAVQQGIIDLAFDLAKPSNYTPATIIQTSTNVARWGLGIAAQFIPGGEVGNGGPPTGWGPVNRDDAEFLKL